MRKSALVICLLSLLIGIQSKAMHDVDATIPKLTHVSLTLDGIPQEDIWKKARKITDFLVFRKGQEATVKTELMLCLDNRNLYLGLICPEPKGVKRGDPNASAWSGDNVEIFFANLQPLDWYRQMVVGVNGKTYNEFIQPEDYTRVIHVEDKLWSAEIIIPLDKLGPFDNHTIRFNLLRQCSSANQLLTWKDVHWGHDADQFGTLLVYTPSADVTHGPWTFGITQTSAGINWETRGKQRAHLYYRRKGDHNFTEALANVTGDIQTRNQTLHPVILRNLTPDTDYEYHVGDNVIRTFRTLSPKSQDFSFATASDIHCRAKSLQRMITQPYVQNTDFFFILGDLVTGMTGRGVCYASYLDVLADYWKKPFYCIRGNHEYRGGGGDTFFELFPVNHKKSYYSFSHKGVCFILLDTDGDDALDQDYLQEQKLWFQNVVKTDAFKNADFRVLMAHYPLYNLAQAGGKNLLDMFFSLPEETQRSFDLMLAGHIHAFCKYLPGSQELISDQKRLNHSKPVLELNFPVLINGLDGCFLVSKDEAKLAIKAYVDCGDRLIDEIIINKKK